MMLADVATYIAGLASIGWVLLAVTTNLLRKMMPGALVADRALLKARQAIGGRGGDDLLRGR